MRVLALSLVLALLVNGLVAIGAAVAAIDASPLTNGPVDLAVSPLSASTAFGPADLVAVTDRVTGEASISPVASRSEPLSAAGAQTTVTVEGVRPNFARLTSWRINQGSFFTSQDEAALNAVAVVSESLVPNAGVGDTIQITGKPFTIIGLGSASRPERTVLVPLRTAQIRLFGPSALDEIFLQVGSATEAATVSRQVQAVLRTRHNLRPGQNDDFTISDLHLATSVGPEISGTRVLQEIEQFGCSAKNICVRRGVN
jgi:putative ABC transport system permease protein